MPYLDLSRRFRDLTQEELEEPELLAYLNDDRLTQADDWDELLQCPRVLLLAEAGSGKTAEMSGQAARLMAEGKPAFFVALESLAREPLTDIISPAEERAFAAWKMDGQSTAWFFLDAVDELKLTGGRLERALSRFAKEIDGQLHRAHIVISCRPYDWRPLVDMETFQAKLRILPIQSIESPTSEDAFLAALRKPQSVEKRGDKKTLARKGLRTVILLPLSEQQIVTFARHLGIEDTVEFIAEIHRRDALAFARRPLDLIDLVISWKVNRRLGTRAEQHVVNVAVKLKDDPDRPDRGILPDEQARSGAERLALALALTHTRTIRSPEQPLDAERTEGVLDPAKILMDWSEEKRQTLLRRALFDPATYGRVRFHHRSVQEYLAACRLRTLREQGMSVKFLRRLLFAERYGVALVIPSMQAISAWLALWDDDVRRELMAREPETLLSMGDPESLPIDARAQLLRAFTKAYGEGGWRGLNIPIDEVRRLADPELASVVREIWDAKPTSPDVSELLLEMIWQGPIRGCADIARAAAFDIGQPDIHRVTAVRALVACNESEILRTISDSILYEPTKWPDRVVHIVVEDLFPIALSVTELTTLISRMREPKNTAGGFSWALRQIADTIEPSSGLAVELRGALANLVWQNRHKKQEWYRLRGTFDYIAPALARLCDKQLKGTTSVPAPESQLIEACVIANRFGSDKTGADESIKNLKMHFEANPMLREAAFWEELKLTDEVAHTEDANEQYFHAEQGSLIWRLTAGDLPWLIKALRSSKIYQHRLVSLHALISLWRQGGRKQGHLDELLAAVQGNAELITILLQSSKPPEPDKHYENWQRREHRQNLVRQGRERQSLEKWAQWRLEVLADPKVAFTAENLPSTRETLYNWLEQRQGGSRYNVWDADALIEAFGQDITMRAAKAFQAAWRSHSPILWSHRSPEDRNHTLRVEGLTGLAAEARAPGWATQLTPDEARIAAAYATIELNGFTSWLQDLAAAHPMIVDEVLGGELISELALDTEHSHLPAVQNLSYADIGVKRLLAPRLLKRLPTWLSIFQDEEHSRRSAHHLGQVLDTLGASIQDHEKANVATTCTQKFSEYPNGRLAMVWLRGLFRFDPERATQVLEDDLNSLPEHKRSHRAIAIFADLFGDRGAVLVFADDSRRAVALGHLTRCAYRYVRHSEDQEHEGVYTPDKRDRAERARDFLLSALLDTPGAEAQKVVIDLAEDPVFAHFPDRLRLLARQRAASDAESQALSPEQVVTIEKRLETSPHDRDGLFTVMKDRLDDLAHDIAHDDFTDRRTLRSIKEESEMQRTLARRLRDAARGAYVVSREDEVADLKRTDIRLVTVRGEHKAVIEVKLADKWSLAELEHALRDQLIGQYLRHKKCKAGCLLLTYDGTKRYWAGSSTGPRLSFAEMAEHLRRLGQAIEQELNYEIRLSVCHLDLTDPLPKPARR